MKKRDAVILIIGIVALFLAIIFRGIAGVSAIETFGKNGGWNDIKEWFKDTGKDVKNIVVADDSDKVVIDNSGIHVSDGDSKVIIDSNGLNVGSDDSGVTIDSNGISIKDDDDKVVLDKNGIHVEDEKDSVDITTTSETTEG